MDFWQIEKKEYLMSKIKVYEANTLRKFFKIWTFEEDYFLYA